jgi:parallel beta-helix repeat protein
MVTKITTTDGAYTVDSYIGDGTTTWTVPAGVTSVEYMVIAGGGSGGNGGTGAAGGGGGAGGVRYGTLAVTPGAVLSIVVGLGGTIGSYHGNKGANSVFSSITSIGGGYGGAGTDIGGENLHYGGPGGSGGGAGGKIGGLGGAGTTGQGYAGGNKSGSVDGGGSGGGGATTVGVTNTLDAGGAGGSGYADDILHDSDYVLYASGGTGATKGSVIYTGATYAASYGVVGDGTDETTRVKNAITATMATTTKMLVFPVGAVICITSRIDFPSGITVYGRGSTLKRRSGSNMSADAMLGVGKVISSSGTTYCNGIKVDGNSLEGGIADDECWDNATVRVRTDNGVSIYSNTTFTNCEVCGIRAYAVQLYSGSVASITNNYIHDNCQYGIATGGGDVDFTNSIITGNVISNCNQVGIKVRGTVGSTIQNNTIYMKQSSTDFARGISIYSADRRSQNVLIDSNTVYGDYKGSNGDAISSDSTGASSCTGITITNNIVSYCNIGIDIYFSNGIITGNTMSHCTDAIHNVGSGNMTTPNTIVDSG